MRHFVILCVLSSLPIACSEEIPAVKADFTTPQGAILVLEQAYRDGDIEAAVAAKSFRMEAELMLKNQIREHGSDEELIAKTADVLELSFREFAKKDGLPDFNGLISSFEKVEPYAENVVVVTERCEFPDGGHSIQRILVGQTPEGWRVLNPLD